MNKFPIPSNRSTKTVFSIEGYIRNDVNFYHIKATVLRSVYWPKLIGFAKGKSQNNNKVWRKKQRPSERNVEFTFKMVHAQLKCCANIVCLIAMFSPHRQCLFSFVIQAFAFFRLVWTTVRAPFRYVIGHWFHSAQNRSILIAVRYDFKVKTIDCKFNCLHNAFSFHRIVRVDFLIRG